MRLLWLLLLVPIAHGQAILEDPTGDQEAGYYVEHWDDEPASWQATDEQGWYRYADLQSVGIAGETPYELIFEARFASATSNNEPKVHTWGAAIMDFLWHDEPWRVELRQTVDGDRAVALVGAISSAEFGGRQVERWRTVAAFDAVDVDGAWHVAVDKAHFRDADQVPMRVGDEITELTASAKSQNNFYVSPCATNDTPSCWKARDTVDGSTQYTILESPPGVGHLFAESKAPYRGSNGVATTYLYNITVKNLEAGNDRVTVQVSDVPKDWQVRAPSTIEVPGNSAVHVPVAVTVPFVHQHGREETFAVRFASTSEPGIESKQDLGVVWHEIPQPGGHHPEVFWHGSGYGMWFNTLPDDEEDDGDGLGRPNYQSTSGDLQGTDYLLGYQAIMLPGLLMGLDFEPQKDIRGETAFLSPYDVEGHATFEFFRVSDGERDDIATQSQPFTFTEGANVLEWTIPIRPGIDRLEFESQSRLIMAVELTYHRDIDPTDAATRDGGGTPLIQTEMTSFLLPLQDFHDVIDEDLLSSLSRLSLRADGPSSKAVNPGKTAAFTFILGNADEEATTVDWHLEGPLAKWATIIPGASTVTPKGEAKVLVTVTPPADADENEIAELLLIGAARSDPDVEVFGRVIATVTTTTDIPDERELADAVAKEAGASEAKPTPPVALGLVLAAVAVAVAARRRIH